MSAATSFQIPLRFPQPRVMSPEEREAVLLDILLEALNRIERLEQLLGVQQLADLEVQS